MKFLLFISVAVSALALGAATPALDPDCGKGFWVLGGLSRFFMPWRAPARLVPASAKPVLPAPPEPARPAANAAAAEPWMLKRWDLDVKGDDYYNLHALGLRPEFKELYRKLGIEIVPPDQVRVPRAKALNDKLAAIGSSFKIEEVNGTIKFDPWMALMAEGKFPVGDKHDLMTHGMAVFMMPPELAGAYRGSLKLFMAMREEPNLPESVQRYVREQLGHLGKGFEVYTYGAAQVIARNPPSKMDFAALAHSYGGLVGFPASNPVGVSSRIRDMKAHLRRNQAAMKISSEDLKRIETRLDGLLAGMKAEDPFFGVELTQPEIVDAVRAHYQALLVTPP